MPHSDTLCVYLMEATLRTRIRKWGNSLGGRIPSAPAEDARLHEGAEVDVTIREGQLVIVPVLSLAELVAEVTLPAECPIQGVAFADQAKCLDWRARHAQHVAVLPAAVVAQQVLARTRALLEWQ